MSQCDQSSSRRFLGGTMSLLEEEVFARHVESCLACREQLEHDAGDEASWRLARDLSTNDVWELQTSDFRESGARPANRWHGIDLAKQVEPYLAPSDDPAALGRLGIYEVLGVIGRGGMGIVLKGYDASLRRNVAIKVLDPSLANLGIARQRFAREARAMAAISHEHVVPIYGVDAFQGVPFFVMEYVAGGTLERRLQQLGPLDTVATIRIAMQIADALAAAHEQGLVHRDIKPGNVLVDAGTERVRVADFGLAQIASDTSETRSGMIAGTPQYMSPEQVRGETCDARSDLFCLGSLMFAMVTGHPPFRASTVYGVMQRIVHDSPRPLRSLAPAAPEWLEQLIERLLAKSPADRFADALEVAEILRQELAHLQNPTQVPVPDRSWRPIQHAESDRWGGQPWMLAAAGISLLTVVLAQVFGPTFLSPPVVHRINQVPHEARHVETPVTSPDRDTASDPLPHIPLWSSDGTEAAQSTIQRMEHAWYGSNEPEDDWNERVQAIQQELQAMAYEMDQE